MRFLAQFNNILIYVLLTAGFVKLMLSLWLDASIIFAVVILNSALDFVQEGRAEKALELDPQHAIGGGAHAARRRTSAHPLRITVTAAYFPVSGDRLSGSAKRVSRHVVSTLPYEVKLKTLFEWPDFGECVSVKVIPLMSVEQNENNFLENIETRAMIATLSADRSLVEVAGLRDEATEQGANCRVWR